MATAGSQQDYLPTTKLNDVFEELFCARTKWYNIGLQLKMNSSDLDAINLQHRENPDPCFRELLSIWLRREDPKPTWAALASALKSQTVGFQQLSKEVYEKHVCRMDNDDVDTPTPHPELQVPIPVVFQCPCGYCDLADYLYKGCPKTTSDSYPYLHLEGLDVSDRKDLVHKLSTETSNIVKKFADLISTVRESLENRNISVKELIFVARQLRSDIIELKNAELIVDVFIILTDPEHMSFFNHEILGRIVEKLGDNDDKKNYERFCNELKVFCGRSIFEVSPTIYSSGRDRKNCILFAVTNKFIKTVGEVKEAHYRIATLLGLDPSQIQVKQIDIGSVIIVFSIPIKLSQGIFPLKPAIHKELMSCGYTLLEPSMFQTEYFLFEAAAQGDWEQVKTLIQEKDETIRINISNQEGKSLLIVAAEGGHELVLLTLLDGGADVNLVPETFGKTALFFAAENGYHEATAILLAYGADRHQTDKDGNTPYSVAKKRPGHEKVCEELEECDSSKRPSVRTISTQQWVSESFEAIRDTMLGKARTTFQWMFSDIIGATKAGDIETVTHILEHSKDLDASVNLADSDEHEWTSLMWACDRGYHKIVDLLLAKGADPNKAAKSNGWSSLMLASRRGYLRIVKTLLDHGAFPDQQNNAGITALAIAIYEGRTAVALLLIHRGADVNLADENGWTPLIRASNEGNLKLVKVISDLGGYINDQTEEGWTSLMVTSHYGHTEVVRELAKRGADFNLSTKAGDTALHIATTRKRHGVVEELATLGANLNESNKDGLTALMVAANKGYNEVVDALLEGGANVNYQHKETDWTAIFFAAKNGHVDVFQSLLSYGAKTEITDKDGTSLSVIDVANHLKQMHILSAMGTPVDYVPIRTESETAKVDKRVRLMDSIILALEKRLARGILNMM